MRIAAIIVVACGLCACAQARAAQALYAATSRSVLSSDGTQSVGNLYRIDFNTGDITLIGATRIGGIGIGITGLADDPRTGVLYGVTAESSPNYPHSLVTIDPATASAKFIGDVGAPVSDITFGPNGNLYAWLRLTRQVAILDPSNGAARPIGRPGPPTETGAIAIDANRRTYVAISGANGTLDTIDTNTGELTTGPQIKGAPFHGLNSLTITPRGRLFGVNTNLGRPASAVLIVIDPATGVASQLSPLPNDADGLVFVEPPLRLADLVASRGALTALAAIVVLVAVVAYFLGTSRRR